MRIEFFGKFRRQVHKLRMFRVQVEAVNGTLAGVNAAGPPDPSIRGRNKGHGRLRMNGNILRAQNTGNGNEATVEMGVEFPEFSGIIKGFHQESRHNQGQKYHSKNYISKKFHGINSPLCPPRL
jgi:hypothetical protein